MNLPVIHCDKYHWLTEFDRFLDEASTIIQRPVSKTFSTVVPHTHRSATHMAFEPDTNAPPWIHCSRDGRVRTRFSSEEVETYK